MTTKLPTRQETGVFPISDGLSIEWKNNGRIIIFTWTSISRETIDEFANAYAAIIKQWPVEEPFNQLNDLRFKGFNFTPYLRNTVQTVIRDAGKIGIYGRVANLLSPDLGMRIVQFFLRAMSFDPGVRADIFSNYDKAIHWLEQPIEH